MYLFSPFAHLIAISFSFNKFEARQSKLLFTEINQILNGNSCRKVLISYTNFFSSQKNDKLRDWLCLSFPNDA